MHQIWKFAILFVFLLFINPVWASTLPEAQPVVVKVGLFVNDISDINEKYQMFTFQGVLMQQWQDSSLKLSRDRAAKTAIYTDAAAQAMLNKIWQPQLVLVNARGKVVLESSNLQISPSGKVTYLQRFQANVENVMNLRRFPFDEQIAHFDIEPLLYSAKQVRLQIMPKHQGISELAKLDTWRINSVRGGVVNKVRPPLTDKHSHYVLTLHYQRVYAYYVMHVMLPIILIVFFSFSVFWIMHNPAVNRIAISLTAILTVVVFQWRVLSDLPHVFYHTFLDMFMLFSFIMAAITVIPTLVYEHVSPSGQARLVGACRLLFPMAYILGLIVVYLLFF